jgi:hypothetical protein
VNRPIIDWGFLESRRLLCLFLGGLALCLLTAVVNIGIIALDDYEFVISQIIPAQTSDFLRIASSFSVRSPIHPLILAAIARVSYWLGLHNPTDQLRFVLFCIGLFTFSMHSIYAVGHFDKGDGWKRETILFLLGFFFICPLFFTRPLIETLSSPFLTLSSCYACWYWRSSKRTDLALALLGVVVASLFRFQTGICVLGLFLTVILKKRLVDLVFLSVLGAIAFYFTGILDSTFTGSFHGALFSYLTYNLRYGAEHYGHQPAYAFLLLFVALTLPPAFVSTYRGLKLKNSYGPLVPTLLYFFLFLISHTAVPHKEERFMVPVLPLFLILLTPLANYFLTQPRGFKNWRVGYFLGVNFILLPLVIFNSPQNNTVGLVRFLDAHPKISRVIAVDSTLTIFPVAFSSRALEMKKLGLQELDEIGELRCGEVLAVRADLKGKADEWLPLLSKMAEFRPGLLERILVWANPKQNFRRDAIELYHPPGCSY